MKTFEAIGWKPQYNKQDTLLKLVLLKLCSMNNPRLITAYVPLKNTFGVSFQRIL